MLTAASKTPLGRGGRIKFEMWNCGEGAIKSRLQPPWTPPVDVVKAHIKKRWSWNYVQKSGMESAAWAEEKIPTKISDLVEMPTTTTVF